MRRLVFNALDFSRKISVRMRGMLWRCAIPGARKVGLNFKLLGGGSVRFGRNFSVGDYCWIECVRTYQGHTYEPVLVIGNNVSISDCTHISCVASVEIGDDCLLGSRIYIGDHSHGIPSEYGFRRDAPASRALAGVAPIKIGARVWIGDGAVILPGAQIASGSIVAANSVVNISTVEPAVIAGVPAKIIKYLSTKPE